MTEVELFGYAIVAATGICVAVWLVLAGCILFSVWEWVRSKSENL